MDYDTCSTRRRTAWDADLSDASGPPSKRAAITTRELSQPTALSRFCHRDYTIGWISALPIEFAAAQLLLDTVHEPLHTEPSDSNHYVLGRMGGFNVAIACLGDMGMNNAATVATNMARTFTAIRLQLVVGVAGGIPSPKNDLRLGDVVVGMNVVQSDQGKALQGGHFQNTATIYSPPSRFKAVLNDLQARCIIKRSQVSALLQGALSRSPDMAHFFDCTQLADILFEKDYEHPPNYDDCDFCDCSRQQARPDRADRAPLIHFGTIASANHVLRDSQHRDNTGERHGALCVEMEGAALKGGDIPFLVIRGICDYADSHKNKQWQPYAAATAAACAKEFLLILPPFEGNARNDPPDPSQILSLSAQAGLQTDSGQDKITYQDLLESLRFKQIDARHANIRKAHAMTCKWLLEKREFREWSRLSKPNEQSKLLWVKGKPGAGKSTLMKFALSHFRWQKRSHIIISFFFNARGDQMEKTVQGMYQSLLWQLLTQRPCLQSIIKPFEREAELPTWTIETMQDLLQKAVQKLDQDSLVCFIDALDECASSEIREMVYFFEELGSLAADSGLRLYICFASRHYPHITVRNAIELVLDGQEGHEQDIADYIKDKLNIGAGKTVQDISTRLRVKAASIFMWVVLVVKILNEQADSGLHPVALRKELDRIPQDLHELFRDILQRDTESRGKLLLCIQWLLFSRRPLTPKEIYLAIHAGSGATEVICAKWDIEEITHGRIHLFLLSASKGLAEITTTENPTVQFIHESVTDFFLTGDGLRDVWPDVSANFKAISHDTLKNCCLEYVRNGIEIAELSRHPSKEERTSLCDSINCDYPFMQYATDNMFWHAEQAQIYGITQLEFFHIFEKLRQPWVTLHNILEKYDNQHYTTAVSLVYLLAKRNLTNLLRIAPREPSCLAVGQELYGSPLFAALATECFEAVREIVDLIRKDLGDDHNQRTSVKQVKFKEPSSRLHRRFVYNKNEDPTWLLMEHGNEIIFETSFRFLRPDITMRDKMNRTLLHFAVQAKKMRITQFLLGEGAAVNTVNSRRDTPLHTAIFLKSKDIVQLLLEKGASVNTLDHNGDTPLHTAIFLKSKDIVQLLLEKGATVDTVNRDGTSPLHTAVTYNNKDIVQLLLEKGAAVDTVNRDGTSPLHTAIFLEIKDIVQLLLEKGASVNTLDHNGYTPLYTAIFLKNKDIIQLLLEKGATVDTVNRDGTSPLYTAVTYNNKDIV
ncbi:ankyrin repeat domain-containing protein 50 [Microdochium nivale]|nr:ankyrin repeat domain-containing protein 50 [Microdochium nivale]